MNILKRIVSILAWICYALIFVYVLICVPMLFGHKPLVVLSGSMEPTLAVGSIIYYHEVDESEIGVGDAITFFYESGDFITHRVTSIEGGLYETKGDANNTVDARKIGFSNIAGKVSKLYIPYLGYYVSFINKHLYLLVVVVAILILEFLFGNTKKEKKLDKEAVKAELKDELRAEIKEELKAEAMPTEPVEKREPAEEKAEVKEETPEVHEETKEEVKEESSEEKKEEEKEEEKTSDPVPENKEQ